MSSSKSSNPFEALKALTNVRRAVAAAPASDKKSAAALRFADAGIRLAAQKEAQKASEAASAAKGAAKGRRDCRGRRQARAAGKRPQAGGRGPFSRYKVRSEVCSDVDPESPEGAEARVGRWRKVCNALGDGCACKPRAAGRNGVTGFFIARTRRIRPGCQENGAGAPFKGLKVRSKGRSAP